MGLVEHNFSGGGAAQNIEQVLTTGDDAGGQDIGDLGTVAVGAELPDGSALMELVATDKGLLPPRMTTAQRTAIGAPADGLVVHDLDDDHLWINIA